MFSQPPTQEELEERKAKIQLEIQEKEQLLQSVKSKEKSVVTQLQIQKEKIGLKEKLIKTTDKQTKLLGNGRVRQTPPRYPRPTSAPYRGLGPYRRAGERGRRTEKPRRVADAE